MTNRNDLHVSVFCPKPLQDIANQLAMTIGLTPADIDTFGNLEMTVNGIECFVALLPARLSFVYVPDTDLTEQAEAIGADPVMTEDAKSRLRVCDLRQGEPAPVLTEDTIAVVVQSRWTEGGKLDREASQRAMGLLGAA